MKDILVIGIAGGTGDKHHRFIIRLAELGHHVRQVLFTGHHTGHRIEYQEQSFTHENPFFPRIIVYPKL